MNAELRKRFQARARALAVAKKKLRYLHVVGKLKKARLLDAPTVPAYGGPVPLEDVLWAGKIEPRILEVLPALLITRPKFFRVDHIPEDLQKILIDIRKGTPSVTFRGIPMSAYCRWLSKMKFSGGRLKTFRFTGEDFTRLESLRQRLGLSTDIEVIRKAFAALELPLKATANFG